MPGQSFFTKNPVLEGSSGNLSDINSDNQLSTYNQGKVDDDNSTITPLGIDGVFTGVAVDVLAYASIDISVFADQPSAVGGLSVEFSTDGTNWDHMNLTTVPANVGITTCEAFGKII